MQTPPGGYEKPGYEVDAEAMIQNYCYYRKTYTYRVTVSDHDRIHKPHYYSSSVTTREFSYSSCVVGKITVIDSTFQTRKPAHGMRFRLKPINVVFS